jgi:sulfhydrogenase subunit beta (sulfur reductase)
MADKVIAKDKTGEFVKALQSQYTVVAPMERGDAPAEFRELETGETPVLDGSKHMMTPKDYLLPRHEVLVKIDTAGGSATVETPLPEDKPRVMLGAWLADAQAIQVLDRVFLDKKFVDPYYSRRRENLAVVAVIPAEMRWSWFCGSVDDVETWKANVDAVMYDLGDKFYFEVISEKGAVLAEIASLGDAGETDTAKKNELWDQFKSTGALPFAGKALYENLAWDDPIWDEISQKCIACGMCSFMCPSCSCFDIQDETHGTCVERYRCRDTCQFEDFTLMGHGHNPRTTQLPRSRQRLLHKFRYQHEQFGVVGCTGCGRCVELCPVNVDIREALTRTCAEPLEQGAE